MPRYNVFCVARLHDSLQGARLSLMFHEHLSSLRAMLGAGRVWCPPPPHLQPVVSRVALPSQQRQTNQLQPQINKNRIKKMKLILWPKTKEYQQSISNVVTQ